MSRPLRFDDQFTSMINQKLEAKFFYCITLKVQSTAFCQIVSLQRGLIISSIFDFSLGLTVFLLFFKILEIKDHESFFIQNVVLILGMFFGLLGADSSKNINKRNVMVYKYWRIFIAFFIPLAEFFNSSNDFCYYSSSCSFWYFTLITAIWLIINIYLIKIVWSVVIRLDKGQELLIIHGRYLDKMLNEENNKLNEFGKKINYGGYKYNLVKEKEIFKQESNMSEFFSNNKSEKLFLLPKRKNPFEKALQNLHKG